MAFRVQARWPGPGQQVFCLREEALEPDEALEPVERVPILQLTRIGRKLAVVLDRGSRKRCEFLTVHKPRPDGSGDREQVFFRTESGIRAHRSRRRVELPVAPVAMDVVIDSGERYAWRFPGATVNRRKLAVGDYALVEGPRTLAVVERKSFPNLLSDLTGMQALHHQLADLAGLERAALVIEAPYRDFLDPARLGGHWRPGRLSRLLAELSALHPRLPVVFAGSRKLANLWAYRFFQAVARQRQAPPLELELALERRYDPPEARPVAVEDEIRRVALEEFPEEFAGSALLARFPDVTPARVRRVLAHLQKAGALRRSGRGPGTRWHRAG